MQAGQLVEILEGGVEAVAQEQRPLREPLQSLLGARQLRCGGVGVKQHLPRDPAEQVVEDGQAARQNLGGIVAQQLQPMADCIQAGTIHDEDLGKLPAHPAQPRGIGRSRLGEDAGGEGSVRRLEQVRAQLLRFLEEGLRGRQDPRPQLVPTPPLARLIQPVLEGGRMAHDHRRPEQIDGGEGPLALPLDSAPLLEYGLAQGRSQMVQQQADHLEQIDAPLLVDRLGVLRWDGRHRIRWLVGHRPRSSWTPSRPVGGSPTGPQYTNSSLATDG